VLEAVAAGLPTVVTPVVWKGLPNQVRAACEQASDAPGFADAIVRLLAQTPHQRRARADDADLASLTWEATLQPLEDLVRAAIS
jgi:hypothetical protein